MAGSVSKKIAALGGSTNDPMGFYLENYLGQARSSSFDVSEVIRRLPDNPCKYVLLSNFNVDEETPLTYTALSADSLYENAGDEIYYGFAGVIAAQLFPSQNSGLLPVSNTNQICVRARPAIFQKKLWYTWFW